MRLSKILNLFRTRKGENCDLESLASNDPLHHPAIMAMSERELGDLPFPKQKSEF